MSPLHSALRAVVFSVALMSVSSCSMVRLLLYFLNSANDRYLLDCSSLMIWSM